MLYIARLALDHYRSWNHVVIDFEPGITVLQGHNGLGKTNIVEAIEVLATGTSHRATGSIPLVERGETSAVIRANVVEQHIEQHIEQQNDVRDAIGEHNGVSEHVDVDELDELGERADSGEAQEAEQHTVEAADSADAATPVDSSDSVDSSTAESTVSSSSVTSPTQAAASRVSTTTFELTIRARGANRGRINGGQSLYMRDIIGHIPVVTFSPEDPHIISGDPSARRSFIDQACTLLVRGYADHVQRFTHIAKQRAALLKQLGAAQAQARDSADMMAQAQQQAALSGLEIWTGQFIEAGIALTRDRWQIIQQLQEPFTRLYQQLSGRTDDVMLQYVPSFEEVMFHEKPQPLISEHFQRIYAGEIARGINLIGPQRDDLAFLMDGVPAREFVSNGEMTTMALALKMALYELLTREYGDKPIVILDDVFAQLDEVRREQIVAFAREQTQVFITAAARSDVPHIDEIMAHECEESDEIGEPGNSQDGLNEQHDQSESAQPRSRMRVIDVQALVAAQSHDDLADIAGAASLNAAQSHAEVANHGGVSA